MQCTSHSEITATGTCTFSGKPFCGDCLIEMEGKYYGKPYLDRALADIRDRASSKSQPNVYMNAGGGGASAAAVSAPSTSASILSVNIISVPFYRKRWFLVLMCLTFSPIAFLSAVTGPLYWHDDDGWRRVSGGGKAAYIILSLWGSAVIVAAL